MVPVPQNRLHTILSVFGSGFDLRFFFREKWHKAIEFISYSQIGAHLGLAELMGLEPVADQKQVIFAEQ